MVVYTSENPVADQGGRAVAALFSVFIKFHSSALSISDELLKRSLTGQDKLSPRDAINSGRGSSVSRGEAHNQTL